MERSMLRRLARWEEEGIAFVTALVVETNGSCPRKAGAMLALSETGERVGTIGGGKVEMEALETGRTMFARPPTSRLLSFSMDAPRDDATGMLCGGSMEIFLALHPRRS